MFDPSEEAVGALLATAPRLRSMLFVPSNKPQWVEKALASDPDAIILDLEDAVPIDDRESARADIGELVDQIAASDVPAFVRVNPWRAGGAILADLDAAVRPTLSGVVLPKTDGPRDVAALALVLSELEAARGIFRPMEIVPLCETASALECRTDIYRGSSRVRRSPAGVFGSPNGDAARSIGLVQTPEGDETAYILGRAVLEGRAAGLAGVMGGMCTSISDLGEVKRVAARSRRFGANGAFAIHPSHVAILHEVYSPSDAEVGAAMSLVIAFARQIGSGTVEAAIAHDGRMVDIAHLRGALAIVGDAVRWNCVLQDDVEPDYGVVSRWLERQ